MYLEKEEALEHLSESTKEIERLNTALQNVQREHERERATLQKEVHELKNSQRELNLKVEKARNDTKAAKRQWASELSAGMYIISNYNIL